MPRQSGGATWRYAAGPGDLLDRADPTTRAEVRPGEAAGQGLPPAGNAPRYAAGLRFAGRWVSQSGICLTLGEGRNQDWMSAKVLNPRDMSNGAR